MQNNQYVISDMVFDIATQPNDPQCILDMVAKPTVNIDEWLAGLDISQLEILKGIADKHVKQMSCDTATRAFASHLPEMIKSKD